MKKPKPRRGRPPGRVHDAHLHIRVDPDLLARASAYCAKRGVMLSRWVRELIAGALDGGKR